MDTSESMSQNSGKQLINWPLLAGLVLLLYDYLLTLPTEIHIVWPRPRPWLLLIRYLALGTILSMVVLTFGIFGLQWNRWISILTLHVYALFNRKRVILWLLSLAGLGSLAIGVWLGSAADAAAPLPKSLCMLSHASHRRRMGGRCDNYRSRLVKCFVLDGSFTHQFGDKALLSRQSCMVGGRVSPVFMLSNYLILTAMFSGLSAVLTARPILNMREVANTNSMSVGDVASVEASTMEWNDIDGIPMEDTRGHVRNRASWGYGNYFE
ncbi:hypothetical protein B0H13DRAFT_1863942 [Mycena leptocephala]|nr:hypothetical protein B0H13DRAFT_1863942 [Mycena leptocephala]